MDIFLLVFSSVFILVGLVGCVLPILPGPPISFVALLMLHYSSYGEFSSKNLWFFGILAIVVTILDYIIPVWGTKRFGGSKRGQWGATIGLLIGVFFSPFGMISIILGPLFGAYLGEISGGGDSKMAMKSALGSFLGFLMGTGIKLITSGVITYIFISEVWANFFA